jgi:Uri superfamily endonuclease
VKGSYILLIKLPEAQTMNIGSLSDICFPQGYYAYVGSALSGIEVRLRHHLNQSKRQHWHIDYLLPKASITDIIIGESEDRVECAIARALSAQFDCIPGFGSSDCSCSSHLFFATNERQMKSAIIKTLESLSIWPRLAKEPAKE